MTDLIDRQAAIDAIWGSIDHDRNTAKYNRQLKLIARILNRLANVPSAQPEAEGREVAQD